MAEVTGRCRRSEEGVDRFLFICMIDMNIDIRVWQICTNTNNRYVYKYMTLMQIYMTDVCHRYMIDVNLFICQACTYIYDRCEHIYIDRSAYMTHIYMEDIYI